MSSETPLLSAIDHVLVRMQEMIEEGGMAIVRDPNAAQLRSRFFSLLHTLPLTSRTMLMQAKSHEGYEPMLFYERSRMGVTRFHFLDAVPSSITLFSGPTTIQLQVEEIRKLRLANLVADRMQTVLKLENMPAGSARKLSLVTEHTAGYGDQVPGPARVLIARCRAMCQGIRVAKREQTFAQCANCNCNRLFYVGEPGEHVTGSNLTAQSPGPSHTSSAGLEEEGGQDSEHMQDATSDHYWRHAEMRKNRRSCRGRGGGEATQRRFCSIGCAAQHAQHLSWLLPLGEDGDFDGVCCSRKSGRARIADERKWALKRNGAIARKLRTARESKCPKIAVSREELDVETDALVTSLNVDLGILYASEYLAESATMAAGKALPGSCKDWRTDPHFYAKAMAGVVRIYAKKKRKEGIVTNLLTVPRYLEAVRANAQLML